MMKKNYQKPEMQVVKILNSVILAGSNIGGSDADGDHAKPFGYVEWE